MVHAHAHAPCVSNFQSFSFSFFFLFFFFSFLLPTLLLLFSLLAGRQFVRRDINFAALDHVGTGGVPEADSLTARTRIGSTTASRRLESTSSHPVQPHAPRASRAAPKPSIRAPKAPVVAPAGAGEQIYARVGAGGRPTGPVARAPPPRTSTATCAPAAPGVRPAPSRPRRLPRRRTFMPRSTTICLRNHLRRRRHRRHRSPRCKPRRRRRRSPRPRPRRRRRRHSPCRRRRRRPPASHPRTRRRRPMPRSTRPCPSPGPCQP